MITWIAGNKGAGKTTLARIMAEKMDKKCVVLDGDQIRQALPGLGLSREDRISNNTRIARLAVLIADQDVNVIVASICPFLEGRKSVREICGDRLRWIYLPGGEKPSDEFPFETEGWP